MNRVFALTLRWILFLPAAVTAGILTFLIGVGLLGPSESSYTQTSALVVSVFNMSLITTATLLVARAVAPSGKPWVVISLAGVLIALNLLEITSAVRALQATSPEPKERIRIAEAAGFICTAGSFLLIAISQIRQRSSANQSA